MIDLFRVELTRLRWRRAVLLLTAAAVIVPGIILAATLYNSRPVSAEEKRQAQEQVAQESQQPYIKQSLQRCEKRPTQYGVDPDGDVDAGCAAAVLPRADWYTTRQTLDLVNERENGVGVGVSVILTMLLLLMGATFAGHDWNSGSLSNQLLFEPRRGRVWLAKGAAVLAVGFVLSLAVLALFWTGLWSAAASWDVPIADHAVVSAYKQAVLGAIFAALAGLGGYALTMLFRSTVATLGVLFAFAVAGSLLIAALGFGSNEKIMPHANYAAYLVGSYTYTDYNDPQCNGMGQRSDRRDCIQRISRGDASLYFGGLLLLAGVPSLLSFRRRDVP